MLLKIRLRQPYCTRSVEYSSFQAAVKRGVERTAPAAPSETENIRAKARGAPLVAFRSNVGLGINPAQSA
jgi:hypothetical protein